MLYFLYFNSKNAKYEMQYKQSCTTTTRPVQRKVSHNVTRSTKYVTAQNEYRQWILFREAENSGRDRPIHPAALGRKNNRLLFRHPDE